MGSIIKTSRTSKLTAGSTCRFEIRCSLPRIVPIVLLESASSSQSACLLIIPGDPSPRCGGFAAGTGRGGQRRSIRCRAARLTRENACESSAWRSWVLYLVLVTSWPCCRNHLILGIIVGIVLGVLIYPYIAIISTVLYFNLVELKEGLVMASETVVEETLIVDEGPADPPPAV
jgi:hypothetical protein